MKNIEIQNLFILATNGMSIVQTAYRFADWRWAGFSVQKIVRRTELSATIKLSSGDGTQPIANVLL
jgi:hypothetical protein